MIGSISRSSMTYQGPTLSFVASSEHPFCGCCYVKSLGSGTTPKNAAFFKQRIHACYLVLWLDLRNRRLANLADKQRHNLALLDHRNFSRRMIAEGENWKLAAIRTPQLAVSVSSSNKKGKAFSLDGSTRVSHTGGNSSALR